MKRRLIVLISCVLVMMAVLCAAANAADDPLRVAMQLSASSFTEPQTINVSIQVSNTSEADMPGPVTLYDPDGNQIEEFGSPTLTVGASKTWEGTWNVTEEQLLAGKLTFKLRYPVYNDANELVNKTRSFSKAIKYEGAVTAVEINRTISPTVAANGKEVTVTYEVINTGTVEVSDVVITENKSISSKAGKISSVPAGEKKTYTFKTTMGKKDLTSEPTITYRANGSTQTVTKEAAAIRYGEMNLSASLSADKKGGAAGDPIALTLSVKNSGKTDFTNVTVTDASLGVVFSGLTVPAGKTEVFKTNIVMNDVTTYQFIVSATDGSGSTVETATDALKLTVVSAEDAISLAVEAQADRTTVYELPGVVKFQVKVTNNSTVDVSDVSVKASGVTLYTFPTILAGETREFTRDVSVSMQGQYQFVAGTKNLLGETQNFSSNIIQIGYAAPTAVPTDAPIITPPVPELLKVPTEADVDAATQQTQEMLTTGAMVAAGVTALGLLLIVIGIIGRIARKVHSAKAVDHLERTLPRDYEQPHTGSYTRSDTFTAPVRQEPAEAEAAPAEEQSAAEPAEDAEQPEQK